MRRTTTVLFFTLGVMFAACRSNSHETASSRPTESGTVADRQTLGPVSLPDLSRMEPAVQQQMREAHTTLMAKVQDAGAAPADLAEAYGRLCNLLMASEYYDAAEPCYLNAQALAPSDVRWPYYLGHLYRTKGQPDNAARSFERALELKPTDLAALVWLGNAYLDQGKAADADPLFARAASVDPRSVAALVGTGRAALARREYSRAVDSLERALSIDPRASMVHYPLALAYRGVGDLDKAEAHLRQRGDVEVGPVDPLMQALGEVLHSGVVYETRGIRALNGGDWKTAEALFRKGLELAPDNASLHHKLGTALSLSGNMTAAVEQFQQALERDPAFAPAHYSLGVVSAVNGRQPDAIERFKLAVRYDPGYTEARLQLAEALRRTGRLDESLPHYMQAIRADPRSAEARIGYALALAGLRRYEEAREQLVEGAKVRPDRAEFQQLLERLRAVAPAGR